MSNNPLIPQSKLPNLGTTIFTQMSALVQQHQAIDLSQGFPDSGSSLFLQERLVYHVAHDADQYVPMTGVQPPREATVDKTADLYDYKPDVNSEVTIAAGTIEALYATITALVRPGNEVICFDLSYDGYAPAIELSGDVVKYVALQSPPFRAGWQAFGALLNDRTRSAIPDIPHNPSATVWHHAGFDALWQAIREYEILVIGDEVYEHICFARQGHASMLTHSELRERVIVISSFGKTYHMTGWKVGYYVMLAVTNAELRKVHQYLTLSVNTPAQLALANILRDNPAHYRELPASYQRKRDVLMNVLRNSQLEILSCEGTYLLLVDYSAVSSLNDMEFCQWLTTEVGVAAIPLSVPCTDLFPYKLTRPCFAKQGSTLSAVAERLVSLQLLRDPGFGESAVGKQRLQAVGLLQA